MHSVPALQETNRQYKNNIPVNLFTLNVDGFIRPVLAKEAEVRVLMVFEASVSFFKADVDNFLESEGFFFTSLFCAFFLPGTHTFTIFPFISRGIFSVCLMTAVTAFLYSISK